MGRKTDGERIDELQQRTAELNKADGVQSERLAYTEKSLDEARTNLQKAEGRIHALERDLATRLVEFQRTTEAQFAALRLDHERQLADLRRAHEAETKLLKQQVEDLKQEQLRWGARLWQFAIALTVVVVGTAATTYLGLKK